MSKSAPKSLLVSVSVAALLLGSGCQTLDRLAQVGESPPLTQPQNPTAAPNYRKVSLPMPMPQPEEREANSLWRGGSRGFFKDQRAANVGDLITIQIDISDEATLNNSTTRARSSNEDAGASSLAGFESQIPRFLWDGANPASLIDAESTSSSSGSGQITRNEDIELNVAAVVTQVLPNGNLVLHGRQELRVNYEVRELQVAGIVRPQDIASDNTVPLDKIAEARLAYGGRGHISDVQQPRLGQQVYDVLFPF